MYSWPEIDWRHLHDERSGQVLELMRARDLSHLVITGFDNIRYATDFRTTLISEGSDWCAAVIRADGEAEVFVPWLDETSLSPAREQPWIVAAHPLPSWAPAVAHPRTWGRQIAVALRDARRVGYELLYPQILDRLREEMPTATFVPLAQELLNLRRRKLPAEIVLLSATGRVGALAAQHGLSAAKPGMSDYEVVAEILAGFHVRGVEFVTHGLCNQGRGSGAWFAAGSELGENDSFYFDVGCYGLGGYACDIGRTGFLGGAVDELHGTYQKLLTAQRIAEDRVRPGARCSEVAAHVNEYLEREGLPRTPYAVGHGVGLRACELPTIHRADLVDEDQVIMEGEVIALEPETVVDWRGKNYLLKIEDNYLVESDGLKTLSG